MRPQKGTKVTRGISLWLLCFFVAILLLPTESAACSYVYLEHGLEVRSDLIVLITYAGTPLAKATVQITKLYGSDPDVFWGSTATDGTVHINGLRPGNYMLDARWLGISMAHEQIEVLATETNLAKSTLEYEWGKSSIAVRVPAGKVMDTRSRPDADPLEDMLNPVEVPMDSVRLELRHPTNGTAYSTVSDERGEFAFDGVSTGNYVLHIQGGKNYSDSDFVVQVTPTAARDSLHLRKSVMGCGGDGFYIVR
jgi:hypothetical protein